MNEIDINALIDNFLGIRVQLQGLAKKQFKKENCPLHRNCGIVEDLKNEVSDVVLEMNHSALSCFVFSEGGEWKWRCEFCGSYFVN